MNLLTVWPHPHPRASPHPHRQAPPDPHSHSLALRRARLADDIDRIGSVRRGDILGLTSVIGGYSCCITAAFRVGKEYEEATTLNIRADACSEARARRRKWHATRRAVFLRNAMEAVDSVVATARAVCVDFVVCAISVGIDLCEGSPESSEDCWA